MNRRELQTLVLWKTKKDRKPLIVNGARQVGKTWLLKEFGSNYFKTVAYLNFESNDTLKFIFAGAFDLTRIIAAIQIEYGIKIKEGESLVIFDEIQEAPEALLSLKYFYEQMPNLHVVCAGSLLGIAVDKQSSFPVGKVEFLDLYPLDFLEYLEAIGQEEFKNLLLNHDWSLIKTFHQKFIDLLRQYYFTGGMPEVLASFIVEKDFSKVREIQKNILKTYELDFSKHAPPSIVPRIRMLWNSIPSQLSKENKKFIYKALRPGARSRDYELALYWLIDAGLVYKTNNLSAVQVPLKMYEDRDAFKLYLLDVGLLAAMVDLNVRTLLHEHKILEEFKGAMTEQYVLQQLKAQHSSSLYYWSPSNVQSEIDFIFEYGSFVWPLEVKAEENLHAKSLKVFHQKYLPLTSFRTSMSNYRREDWITNVPLYSIGEIYKIAENFIDNK